MNEVLPLWIATALYLWMAYSYIQHGQPGHCVAFLGYAFANLGFIWDYVR